MKFCDYLGNTNVEKSSLDITDAEARKYRNRRGLDTPVVYTVNDAYLYELISTSLTF